MQTVNTKKKQRVSETSPIYWWELIIAAVPVCALIIYYIFVDRNGFADAVVNNFGLPVRHFLGFISSGIPFSVMEALLTISCIWGIYFVVKTIALFFRRPGTIIKRIFILALIAVWIWAGLCYLWGADYYTESFSEKSGLLSAGSTSGELAAVTAYFAENANAMSGSVPRGDSGSFDTSSDDILATYLSAYHGLVTEFPVISGPVSTPKSMIFSKVMSRTGFTGVFFPFTGETNVNTDMPRALLPFTVAHELAHQLGVTAEQECNFLGVVACVSSDHIVYQYSGWLAGLLYTSRALYTADYDKWLELYITYSDGVMKDFSDNNAYWVRWESPITDAAEKVYDGYLKSQGQELGIKSYGACVDLLIKYFLPATN